MELMAEHPVKVTNPEKLLWPDAGVTKVDYMRYLIAVAPALLRHLADRPLTMIRFPHGIHGHSFFQKDAPQGTPDWVRTTPIWSSDRNEYIHSVIVDSVATLLWLANMGCLEMHVGFTTVQRPEEPTAIAFDIDPSVPGFDPVREVALCLHDLLDRLGLPHIAKTSGATGLQVFLPLAPGHTFDDTRLFTKAVAEYLLKTLPNIVTLERLTKNRGRKVYVDYPQHGATRTLIAAYSTRAREPATVSTPLRWSELRTGAYPEQFTVKNVPKRLHDIGDLLVFDEAVDLHDVTQLLAKQHSPSL